MFGFLFKKKEPDKIAEKAALVSENTKEVEKQEKTQVFRCTGTIGDLDNENQHNLSLMYQEAVFGDSEKAKMAAKSIAGYMRDMKCDEIIRLGKRLHDYDYLEWYYDWRKVDIDSLLEKLGDGEDFLWVARLGTFHSNGYFREKCMRAIECDEDSLKYIILRLNDSVKEIRDLAERMCEDLEYVSDKELISCVPFLSKVLYEGRRRNEKVAKNVAKEMAERLKSHFEQKSLLDLNDYDFYTKKSVYRFLMDYGIVEKYDMKRLLDREKNRQCQAIYLTEFISCYGFSVDELDFYIHHKSKIVQKVAIERKYETIGDCWDGLEQMLLSPAKSIRETVRYILSRHSGIDVTAFYKDHLDTPVRKIAILGIGETGEKSDADLLMKYLEDQDTAVVKNTIHAIAMLCGDKADEIFWKYLQDQRLIVMNQAYREICAYRIKYGAKAVYELFVKAEAEFAKQRLARMLVHESSWDRLPYVLMLYSYEDESIRDVIRTGVYGRNMYGSVSEERAAWIREIMNNEKYQIPKGLCKSINYDLKFVTH